MRRLGAILSVSVTLLAASVPLHSQAKEKVKLEVVSAYTFTYMDWGTRTVPAAPEQTVTTCKGTSGIYSPNYGSTCVSTTTPAAPEHSVAWPTALGAYDGVAVILPTGEHLILICNGDHDKHCGNFLNDKVTGLDKNCADPSPAKGDANFRYLCTYSMHGYSTLGRFNAIIDGEKITISGPDGKRVYHKYGTWGDASASPRAINVDNSGSTPEPPEASSTTSSTAISPEELRKANAGDAKWEFIAGADYFAQGNYGQAATLFRRAADQGDADAQLGLGMLYYHGEGVPQSYAEAYFWDDLAAALANGASQTRFAKQRDAAAARLSPAERNQVQQRAAQWFSEHRPHPAPQ